MNYYNEFDPHAAQWLKNLIAGGLIPPGIVDTRSIVEVTPDDIKEFTQCHFFAGIGGWGLALSIAGWPANEPVWTGSCPCQPFSVAGKGLGTEDERHLWPHFRRLISDRKPPVCFGEQVASKAGRDWLSGVRLDLEAMGYAVGAADLCASGIGAPHIRQRLYWVADSSNSDGGGRECRTQAEIRADSERGRGSSSGSTDSRMADTTGTGTDSRKFGLLKNGRSYRGSEDCGEQSADSCMGYTYQPGLERYVGDGLDRNKSGRILEGPHGSTYGAGNSCGMEISESDRRGERQPAAERFVRGLTVSRSSPWGGAVFIPCADGKARRIEPGLAPLVDGFSGRVGLIRGYGNAIVPQVAAEFIAAFMECCP